MVWLDRAILRRQDGSPLETTFNHRHPIDLGIIGSAEFASASYPREWLIKGISVKGKPGVFGGPQKSMKTSTVIDFIISLGSGRPFLGEFEVPTPTKSFVISGESGEATIQETMRRVCRSKEIKPESLEGLVFWGFSLPELGNSEDLGVLANIIVTNAIEVVIIDPLYLCLTTSGKKIDPANLFDVGPLLKKISAICLASGATPFLVHHFRKNRENLYGLPDLEDLAFSGIQEFSRQWILVGRRQRYHPGTGLHELYLSVGGSDGHSGEWAIDVNEGILDENFGDRDWRVSVSSSADAIEVMKAKAATVKSEKATAAKSAKETKRNEEGERKLNDQAKDVLKILKNSPSKCNTSNGLREFLGCAGKRMNEITELLLQRGQIREVKSVEVVGKDDKKRSFPGFEFLSDDLP